MSKSLEVENLVIIVLKDIRQASILELEFEIEKLSPECKDQIPWALKQLERHKLIKKEISKSKKAIVWSLI